jgi:Cu(I)/Ag(I) efflux system membrane protein CusA/SilA
VAFFFSTWPDWLKAPLTATFWPETRHLTLGELKYGWTDPDGSRHPGLNEVVNFPGVANAWPYPIENRLSMLATGIKTPVGIKILGPDLVVLGKLAERTAGVIRGISGTQSAFPERTVGGYYLDINIDRLAAARYGLTTGEVQDVIKTAIGGVSVTTTVEGVQRHSVNVRYLRDFRDDPEAIKQVLVPTVADSPSGAGTESVANVGMVPLGQLAEIRLTPGPSMIRSENAQHAAWIFVDIQNRDLGGYVAQAQRVVGAQVPLPPGYTRVWSGQFEYLEQANRRLALVIPLTITLIVVLLYLSNQSWFRVSVILLAVPFSLIGALWLVWALDYNMSLAVWVGIIALLGVDAETGQVMLLYLDNTYARRVAEGRLRTTQDLYEAIHEGAVKRIRPKTMTLAIALLGLLPLLWATGTGAEVTSRLVAPLIGGISVSFLMELLVYPVIFYLAKRRGLSPGA